MRMLYQNMHLSFIKKRALALFLLMKRRYNQSIKLSLIPWVYKPKLYICFPKFNNVFHCFTPIQCKYVSTRLVSFLPPVYALKRMNILTESSFLPCFWLNSAAVGSASVGCVNVRHSALCIGTPSLCACAVLCLRSTCHFLWMKGPVVDCLFPH